MALPPSGFNKNHLKPAISSFQKSNDFQPIYKALGLHNFYAQTHRELPFKKGDTILVKRRINDDWLEGEYQGKIGIFPVNHVELFPYEPQDNSLKQSNENEHVTTMSKSVLKTSPGLQQTAIEKPNLPLQKCQVLYDYSPQNPDELEIHVGDIINIIEMCDDGWYCGVMEKSNHENKTTFGTFPGNYVKILPI